MLSLKCEPFQQIVHTSFLSLVVTYICQIDMFMFAFSDTCSIQIIFFPECTQALWYPIDWYQLKEESFERKQSKRHWEGRENEARANLVQPEIEPWTYRFYPPLSTSSANSSLSFTLRERRTHFPSSSFSPFQLSFPLVLIFHYFLVNQKYTWEDTSSNTILWTCTCHYEMSEWKNRKNTNSFIYFHVSLLFSVSPLFRSV